MFPVAAPLGEPQREAGLEWVLGAGWWGWGVLGVFVGTLCAGTGVHTSASACATGDGVPHPPPCAPGWGEGLWGSKGSTEGSGVHTQV